MCNFLNKFIVILFFTALLGCSPQDQPIPRVFIFGYSGIRAEDMKYIRPQLQQILNSGTTYTNLINQNSEMHVPSAQAIVSGVNYPWMKFGGELLHPSIFQYVMSNYPKLNRNQFWCIGAFTASQMKFTKSEEFNKFPYQLSVQSKDLATYYKNDVYPELRDLLTDAEKIFFRNFTAVKNGWPHWDSFGEIYGALSEKIIQNRKPFIMLSMSGEAESAHYGNRARYIISLKKQTERILRIWNEIKKDKFYKGKTYFIVFADHHRDQYYMDHNENSISNRSKNWMTVYGPDVPKGKVFDREIFHRDLFPTLAKIYDVKVHANAGNLLFEVIPRLLK